MKRVLKYTLPVYATLSEAHEIEVQKDSVFLKAVNQKDNLALYFEVDINKESETLSFMCLHTGDSKPANPSNYVDTILFNSGEYVLHIYRLI